VSALPKIFDWFSCSGWKIVVVRGKKPNFDSKPQKSRNDSSYQFEKSRNAEWLENESNSLKIFLKAALWLRD